MCNGLRDCFHELNNSRNFFRNVLRRNLPLLDVQVDDVGTPANWVKINVRATNDSFEVFALVPGLSLDEVRVQFDPAGRLVITGQPNQLDNFWGITSFKKVVTLPARVDQLRTHGALTLHGCLHVHVPFAQQNL